MEKLVIIETNADLELLKQELSTKTLVAFDTETTGVDSDSRIIGFSVCFDTDLAYYVVLSYWDKEQQKLIELETMSEAKAFLEALVGKQLIMHNGVFDCYMVANNFKVELIKSLHTDTMILSHLLNENRSHGLKELGVTLFGADAKEEQKLMKESVIANGGTLTKNLYEMYKADKTLMANYGAKDAILTLKIFYVLIEDLFAQGLDKFFYDEESMPLLRGPTYEMNTTGLKVDMEGLAKLRGELEVSTLMAKAFIDKEVYDYVKDKYPGTSKTKIFNIGSSKQLAWLLFDKLDNTFGNLTKEGKNVVKAMGMRIPYNNADKRTLVHYLIHNKDQVYEPARFNPKTKKLGRPKKIGDYWNYLAADKAMLKKFENKYAWVKKYLEYAKDLKLLNTYVIGMQERVKYGVIRPSFLQHGTTSGRYSSRNPNFQNLPRDDKRVKSVIKARPGKVFIGADYSQLEPRVFASYSQDERLMNCFKNGEDFYSVIGAEVFDKVGLSLIKNDENSFAKKFPKLRDMSKVVALSATYGTTASKMAPAIGKSTDEAQGVIDDYFEKFPKVKEFMLNTHKLVKANGQVVTLFNRPRRIPFAKEIEQLYGNTEHAKLPYDVRTFLNLGVNHTIQGTGASIMNRAAIAINEMISMLVPEDKKWSEVKIVMQVHDELILEAPVELSEEVKKLLKIAMEETIILPGVDLVAEPAISDVLSGLK